jgi:hypothetical protein
MTMHSQLLIWLLFGGRSPCPLETACDIYIYRTLGNAIPTTMLSVYHVFKDASVLQRVRHNLENTFGDVRVSEIDPSQLIQDPLLSSIQAETLRLYFNVCVMLSSPHADVPLGRW